MAKKKLKMSPYIIRMTIDEQIPKLTDFIGNSLNKKTLNYIHKAFYAKILLWT